MGLMQLPVMGLSRRPRIHAVAPLRTVRTSTSGWAVQTVAPASAAALLLGLSATGAAAVPRTLTLRCTGSEAVFEGGRSSTRPFELRLAIDLKARTYCEDACGRPNRIASVSASKLVLRDHVEAGLHGNTLILTPTTAGYALNQLEDCTPIPTASGHQPSAPDANAAVPPWYAPLPGGHPPARASDEARSARTLAGAELEGVLSGSMLRRRGSGTTLPDLTENFDLNGTWMLTGKRVPVDGTYFFEGDQFCVEFPRARVTCRQLLIGRYGSYFTRKRGDTAYAEPVEIRKPK